MILSEELVVMALCDDGTPAEEKQAMVQALLAADRPQHFAPEIPAHRPELLNGRQEEDTSLADFIGPRSWLLFDVLQLDASFLALDPTSWHTNEDYRRFHNILASITCVNDVAERAVRDVVDYINYSHDDERNGDVILVVNSHRELVDFAHLSKEECANLT